MTFKLSNLNLRLRVFLFFCLSGLGGSLVVILALWFGFRQLGQPEALSAFVTSGIIAGFGVIGLTVFIWLMFDENVSKPIEAIAASLRVRSHVDMNTPIDVSTAKYLGDLAPAASAMGSVLENVSRSRTEDSERQLARMKAQTEQFVEILSDIPVGTFLMTENHKIALYDGQAATVMERVGHARLRASIFDYLDKAPIMNALAEMDGVSVSRIKIDVTAHCGDVYSGHIRTFGAGRGYTLMLEALRPSKARSLTYDFELLTPESSVVLRDKPLRELTYVVFDCETTGLEPKKDEVVQVGAIRVVNGRPINTELFDTLVNPGMPIPVTSTKVHGIDNSMVAQAPAFGDVCANFQKYAKDSVLVAHNAAFDMAFLHKQAKNAEDAFDHPVLDTVLLSAVVFGGSATHTLDAICDRFGVTIPEEQRHTAMGDAVATAEVFVKMVSVLEGRGIVTFGALQDEAEKHLRIVHS